MTRLGGVEVIEFFRSGDGENVLESVLEGLREGDIFK